MYQKTLNMYIMTNDYESSAWCAALHIVWHHMNAFNAMITLKERHFHAGLQPGVIKEFARNYTANTQLHELIS